MASNDTILAACRSAVGAEHVLAGESSTALAYRHRLGGRPVAIARPGDVAALAALVKAVRGAGATLWTTPNAVGNGATLPPASGPVVVADLGRMNKVLEVNEAAAYCLLEPGVTFAGLAAHLAAHAPGLRVDADRNAAASVAGSALDREIGSTPYGDHLLMQCGLEIMLADGSLVRTGMGALPDSNTWQLFKYGFGPYIDGLFTQSDYAIVTKVGVWLMPAPPAFRAYRIALPDATGLAAALELLGPLRQDMVVPSVVATNATLELAPHAGPADAAALRLRLGLGEWNVWAAVYGLPENVEVLHGMLSGAFASLPGAKVTDAAPAGDATWAARQKLMRGEPAPGMDDLSRWGGPLAVAVALAAPVDGEDAKKMDAIARDVVAAHGFEYLAEFVLGWRSAHLRVFLPHDPALDSQVAAVDACVGALAEAGAAAGYGITHAPARLLARVQAPYTDGGLAALRERVRKALA